MSTIRKLTPIAVSILLSFPMLSHSADLAMENGTIRNSNGVPVVDINKPNSNGLSHNKWDMLNVDKNGLVFNNSSNGTTTVLAKDIQGNANLTAGAAKVILNEVTSKNSSTLNGMLEVAGDKADLIIANPNGITVNGSGGYNTGKLTLTTGTPDIKDDKLAGYSVNGGTIDMGKFDVASPTEIIARNVVVNGKVSANELKVITGNNYVSSDGQIVDTVEATGAQSTYSIDVAKLGGMYADKINLVSTEEGVGVRNSSVISGGISGINITTNGVLLNNNGLIQSSGVLNAKTNGSIDNTTGTLTSVDSISIDTNKNNIVNVRAGNIITESSINISSGNINNTNGKISAGGMLAADTNGSTLTNSGKGKTVGINAGIARLKTGTLDNSDGQIYSRYVGLDSSNINNTDGIVDSSGDIDMVSSANVNNTGGLFRSSEGHVQISAIGTVTNATTKSFDTSSTDSLGIIAGKNIFISADTINNNNGQVASNGDINLESVDAINNLAGKIVSSAKVIAKGASFSNNEANLSSKQGIDIQLTGNLTNYIGFIGSEGDVTLGANLIDAHGGLILGKDIDIESKTDVNHNSALVVANNKLTVNAEGDIENQNSNTFGANYGLYFGMPQQEGGMIGKGGVTLSGQNIDNSHSRILSVNSPLSIQAKNNLDNNYALISSDGDAVIEVGGTFGNNYSTTWSGGNLSIETGVLTNLSTGTMIDNNATGIVASDKDLILSSDSNLTNYGWISGTGNTTVNVDNGTLYNYQVVSSDKTLTIKTVNGIENHQDISAGEDLNLNTEGYLTNFVNSNMVGENININAVGNIINSGNIVSDVNLTAATNGNINNSSNMLSYGTADMTANAVTNSGVGAVLGGIGGFELKSDNVNNTGSLVGL